jgi:hypothetical protein
MAYLLFLRLTPSFTSRHFGKWSGNDGYAGLLEAIIQGYLRAHNKPWPKGEEQILTSQYKLRYRYY